MVLYSQDYGCSKNLFTALKKKFVSLLRNAECLINGEATILLNFQQCMFFIFNMDHTLLNCNGTNIKKLPNVQYTLQELSKDQQRYLLHHSLFPTETSKLSFEQQCPAVTINSLNDLWLLCNIMDKLEDSISLNKVESKKLDYTKMNHPNLPGSLQNCCYTRPSH